tara:strand:- start:12313 stop:12624 length:312 start_codon:yes stop_codon:yes gene_type:complete
MTSNETNNKSPSNDRYLSPFSQLIPTIFDGWTLGIGRVLGIGSTYKDGDSLSNSIKVNNNVEIKEHQCKDILTEYNICAQNIKPDENINKCKDVIELYRACVS